MAAPMELIQKVPLFESLDRRELQGLASSLKERTYKEGDTIATEGESGVGFFVIDDGQAAVTVGGEERRTLGPGDYFGEVALIDDGARTATVSAKSDLRCYGITAWEFRPLVEENAGIAWKLLEQMAKRLRTAELHSG